MATKAYMNGGNMHLAPVSGYGSSTGFMGSITGAILKWQERATMRHHLASLDKVYLTDMGLSASQIETETGKAFWQS
ncbi:MAG: hypothetical protein WDZ54_03110 [Sneathiella sp.]